MFVLADSYTFTHKTKIKTPVDGGHRIHEIKVTYKVIPQDEIDDLLKTEDGDKALLREVVTDWDGVADEDKNPIEFSEDVLEQLMKLSFVRVAMVKTFFAGLAGVKEKN